MSLTALVSTQFSNLGGMPPKAHDDFKKYSFTFVCNSVKHSC